MKKHLKEALGERIRAVREEERELSIEDVTSKVINKTTGEPISGSYLRRIEKGEESPTIDTFFDIIEALDISIGDFFCPWLSVLNEEEEAIALLRRALRSKGISRTFADGFVDSARAAFRSRR